MFTQIVLEKFVSPIYKLFEFVDKLFLFSLMRLNLFFAVCSGIPIAIIPFIGWSAGFFCAKDS